MKAQTLSALFALAASLQQVTAWGWSDSPSYKCPKNSCDKCTNQQSSGFDWSDLSAGDFSSYGGFDFEGFSCQNSFGKRDVLTGRNFQSKCISGSASSEPEKCPKASCSDVSSFSIDIIEISVEFDCDLDFYYGMEDGSTCKQRSSCSKEGTSVKNTQCGGAKNVTVVLPSPPKSSPTCSVGIHSIGFNCPSSCTTTTKATPTSMTSTKPAAVTTTSSPISIVSSPGTQAASTSATSTSITPTTAASSPSTPSSKTSASATANTSAISSISSTSPSSVATSPSPISSSVATSPSPVSSSSPATTPTSAPASPATTVTTVIVETTVTTCPVTNVHTTGGTTSTEITQTVSTIITTKTSTVCPKCEASATIATSSSPAQATQSCPAILPSCLNTWMSIVTDCSSNDDYNCFCPNSNLTVLVFECLSAHGASDNEVSSALSYFQGICAQYVPQNPAIVTGATAALTATAAITGPVTTIQVYTTVVVPCTLSNGPSSTTTTISSVVTVPQVVLTTVSGTSVGIVQGTAPAAVTASATAVTTMATVAATTTASGNSTATATPKFTGAASRSSAAFSLIAAAVAFAFFAM